MTPKPKQSDIREKKQKYEFLGMVLADGDKFIVQEEKPGENPHNPSGKAIVTFNHNSYTGWKKL